MKDKIHIVVDVVLLIVMIVCAWRVFFTSCEQFPPAEREQSNALPYAEPASFEEISKAFVCVCADKKYPGGSGCLVGACEPNGLRIYLLTARHVAEECIKVQGLNSLTMLFHCTNAEKDIRKAFSGEGVKWGFSATGSDLAVIDVTQPFNTMRKEGNDLRYIPLQVLPQPLGDSAAVQGTFVVPRSAFDQYRLGVGSPIGVFGSASEIWRSIKQQGQQPLGFRSGVISTRNDTFRKTDRGSAPIFLVECAIRGGYSGGPVFGTVKVGGLDYPVLIGVVKATIAGEREEVVRHVDGHSELQAHVPSGFGVIAPLDDLLEKGVHAITGPAIPSAK